MVNVRIVNKTGTFERTNPVKQDRFKDFSRVLLNVFCSDKDIEMFGKMVAGKPTVSEFLELKNGFRWEETINVPGPEQEGVRALNGRRTSKPTAIPARRPSRRPYSPATRNEG